jgi:microcin C transport system substrate-binding protein
MQKLFRELILTATLIAAAITSPASAQEWHTTSALMGESKYGDSFQRYDYVNPEAPKGGTLNSTAFGTFDSFNPFIERGTAPVALAGRLYDTLMQQAIDEPGISHASIADAYKYAGDFSSATYRLDPRAKWHDGRAITVEDVIWSLKVLKENNALYSGYFANVTDAVAVGEREVEFRFNQKGNRELPKIMGDLYVLPKHWWEGADANGKKRNVTLPTLEAPLGSGAYRIKSFKPGTEIVWERVSDYWAAELPVNVGRNNFDLRRDTYFYDDNAMWQAFIKGGTEDINSERSAKDWMTKYDFPALKAGDVLKKEFKASIYNFFQGFVLNTRRPLFADRNVRRALTLAYDFETYNKLLSFGLNKRVNSYFVGGELASSGIPEGKELEILAPYKDQLPAELFTQPFALPVYDQPQDERKHLQEAIKAFGDAGWHIKDGRMVNDKTGDPFVFEILTGNESYQITVNGYISALRKIGVTANLRVVDPTQYQSRVRNFDFDVITSVLNQSDSPGNEQRDFWSTKAADTPGSRNMAGIKNPVVDAVVERVIFATNREDLVAATHALDRILLWNYYNVPQFSRGVIWLAYWNKFGIPDKQPDYTGPDIESWWIDVEKEKALAAKYKGSN